MPAMSGRHIPNTGIKNNFQKQVLDHKKRGGYGFN
jgi:hypothetical protein